MGYFAGPLVGRAIAFFPPRLIYPFIFLTAFVASYSARQSLFDIGLALIFGVVGYLMRRAEFSAPAFVIAFVLARGAEEAFRQSLLLSDSGIGIFLERPVAIAFLAIGLAVMLGRAFTAYRQRRTAQ